MSWLVDMDIRKGKRKLAPYVSRADQFAIEKQAVLSLAVDKEQRRLAETILDDDYQRFRAGSFVTLKPGETIQSIKPRSKGCDYCGRVLKHGSDDCRGCGAPVMMTTVVSAGPMQEVQAAMSRIRFGFSTVNQESKILTGVSS